MSGILTRCNTLLLILVLIVLLIPRTSNFESIFATASSEQEIENRIRQEIRDLLSDGSSAEQPIEAQELSDPHLDMINITGQDRNLSTVLDVQLSTDLSTVNYFANEKTFNATLWLYDRFEERPFRHERVTYGMFIDADFLQGVTGGEGIDYQLDIYWDNASQTWNKQLIQWSSSGDYRILEQIRNYTGFFEKGGNYVELSLNLDSLVLQKNYLIVFYAGTRESLWDFTERVVVPTPIITLSTLPSNMFLRPGEERVVELRANSTNDYDIGMVLSATESRDVDTHIVPERLQVPPHSMAISTLYIRVSENAVPRPYTIPIIANFTPAESSTISKLSKSENHSTTLATTLTILPPLAVVEQFGNVISGITLLTFLAIPTLFSIKPFFTKRLPDLINLEHTEILNIDVAVIAGVLIFLSLEGFEGTEQAQVTFITANIVFPFAISAIVALTKFKKFAIRLTIAGFVNLMVSIILIAILKG